MTLNFELATREVWQAYGHYAETINGVASRPRVRRLLQQAWDLAYAWVRQEPPCHHLALPWQAVLSLVATAFYWGWIKEAGGNHSTVLGWSHKDWRSPWGFQMAAGPT